MKFMASTPMISNFTETQLTQRVFAAHGTPFAENKPNVKELSPCSGFWAGYFQTQKPESRSRDAPLGMSPGRPMWFKWSIVVIISMNGYLPVADWRILLSVIYRSKYFLRVVEPPILFHLQPAHEFFSSLNRSQDGHEGCKHTPIAHTSNINTIYVCTSSS